MVFEENSNIKFCGDPSGGGNLFNPLTPEFPFKF